MGRENKRRGRLFLLDAPNLLYRAVQKIPRSCVPGTDPGTGLDVAEFLSLHSPVCPVILHTSNFDGRLSMHNQLRAGGWAVATVPPRESDWIQTSWLPLAKRLMEW